VAPDAQELVDTLNTLALTVAFIGAGIIFSVIGLGFAIMRALSLHSVTLHDVAHRH
jgi:hypothetical protein